VKSTVFIGIDGIDATGKTTLIEILNAVQQGKIKSNVYTFTEFSSSPLGKMIKRTISENRFYSLQNPAYNGWADSYSLLADWMFKVEKANRKPNSIFLSDRSYTSVLGYQTSRIQRQYSTETSLIALQSMKDTIYQFLSTMDNVRVIEILLVTNRQALKERVALRGELPMDINEEDMLLNAQSIMQKTNPDLTIDVTMHSIEEVRSKVIDYVKEKGWHIE